MSYVLMFYDYSKFCSNEHCVPHVSSQDENVEGNGQWATLPNGIMFARMLGDGRYYTAPHTPIRAMLSTAEPLGAQSKTLLADARSECAYSAFY